VRKISATQYRLILFTSIVVVFVAFESHGQRATVPCPTIADPVPTAGAYSRVASPDSQPARCFFCGKINKHNDDGTLATCRDGSPCPWIWWGPSSPSDNLTAYIHCGNLRDPAESGYLMGNEALESAEIRGWITHVGGFNAGEDEWQLEILLDVGWARNPNAQVTAINTVDMVAQWVSPLNIAAFGYAGNYSSPYPPVSAGASNLTAPSELGANGVTYGGNNSAVIHLEIDGWGPVRGKCDGTVDCTSWSVAQSAPIGWKDYGTGTYWPFDVTSFTAGQYVRAVGTVWHDGSHKTNGPPNACTENVKPALGWTEMHNVDFMEAAQPSGPQHVLAGYALCFPTSSLLIYSNSIDDSFLAPSNGIAPAGASLVVASRHFGEAYWGLQSLISFDSLDSPWRNDPNSRRTSTLVQTRSFTDKTYSVRYNVSTTSPPVAYVGEWVDTYWNTCPAASCPNPNVAGGCQGVLFSSDANNCGTCARRCAAPLTGNGAPLCDAGACTFTCSPGYCSSSTDCVATSLATDLNNCGTCGNTCPSGMSCSGGNCTCSSGQTNCSGQCANLSSDTTHCGSCSNVCQSGYKCVSGSCSPLSSCPSGSTDCLDGTCAKPPRSCN
jgi:stigma-specific protein Stig1